MRLKDLADELKAVVKEVTARQATVELGHGYTGIIPVAKMSWARKPNPHVSGFGGNFISDARKVLSVGDLIYVKAEVEKAKAQSGKDGKKEAASENVFDPQTVSPNKPILLSLQQEPLVQGALVSIEPRSGNDRGLPVRGDPIQPCNPGPPAARQQL